LGTFFCVAFRPQRYDYFIVFQNDNVIFSSINGKAPLFGGLSSLYVLLGFQQLAFRLACENVGYEFVGKRF
jgi:hypothetical protein